MDKVEMFGVKEDPPAVGAGEFRSDPEPVANPLKDGEDHPALLVRVEDDVRPNGGSKVEQVGVSLPDGDPVAHRLSPVASEMMAVSYKCLPSRKRAGKPVLAASIITAITTMITSGGVTP